VKAVVDATATTGHTTRRTIWPRDKIWWCLTALDDDADVDAANKASETGVVEMLSVVVASFDEAGGICSALAKHPSKRPSVSERHCA